MFILRQYYKSSCKFLFLGVNVPEVIFEAKTPLMSQFTCIKETKEPNSARSAVPRPLEVQVLNVFGRTSSTNHGIDEQWKFLHSPNNLSKLCYSSVTVIMWSSCPPSTLITGNLFILNTKMKSNSHTSSKKFSVQDVRLFSPE